MRRACQGLQILERGFNEYAESVAVVACRTAATKEMKQSGAVHQGKKKAYDYYVE